MGTPEEIQQIISRWAETVAPGTIIYFNHGNSYEFGPEAGKVLGSLSSVQLEILGIHLRHLQSQVRGYLPRNDPWDALRDLFPSTRTPTPAPEDPDGST